MDPHVNYNFLVEIGGIARAAFQQVSGLDSTIDVIEHREGGDNATPRKFPGQTKYSNITLRWGMTDDQELYDWHRSAVKGTVARRDGSVVLMDRTGAEVARWNFFKAWPSKWTGPEFDAEASDIAIEALEIVHEGVERA